MESCKNQYVLSVVLALVVGIQDNPAPLLRQISHCTGVSKLPSRSLGRRCSLAFSAADEARPPARAVTVRRSGRSVVGEAMSDRIPLGLPKLYSGLLSQLGTRDTRPSAPPRLHILAARNEGTKRGTDGCRGFRLSTLLTNLIAFVVNYTVTRRLTEHKHDKKR